MLKSRPKRAEIKIQMSLSLIFDRQKKKLRWNSFVKNSQKKKFPAFVHEEKLQRLSNFYWQYKIF